MFSKRRKRSFSPELFIPKPARITAILQLCLAFTAILFAIGYPFMGELFDHKAQVLLYHQVMGTAPSIQKAESTHIEGQNRLKRNAERFSILPEAQKSRLIAQHDTLQTQANRSFWQKCMRALHILALELPPLERLWIIFSIAIALMLLLRIEGAVQAAWLLPLIVTLYAYDNYVHAPLATPRAGDRLFPSEAYIVENYLKHPLSNRIAEQHDQLLKGWQLYLVAEWSHEEPARDPMKFSLQVEQGQFAFDVARLDASRGDETKSVVSSFYKKESPLLLMVYVLWNFFFAWCVVYYSRRLVPVKSL